jgi:arginyl-tRNA--protein-N-Asp/Glu arginylyltransferase
VENQDKINEPITVAGALLDRFLELGFYRMMQTVFTTDDCINTQKGEVYDVFWLRILLQPIKNVTQHKIFKKNKDFEVTITKAKFNKEIDDLYERYRLSMNFEAHESIHYFLFGSEKKVVFQTKLIQIRHHGKLIAGGYFDEGKESIAGILNFYDPEYSKYSLGKFLMLVKIQYAQQRGMVYYYPGYIALDTSKFDYKVFPSEEVVEVLVKPEENTWFPFTKIGKQGLERYGFWHNCKITLGFE